MITINSAGQARSILFGIFVLLDLMMFLKGFDLQPLPEYKQLGAFRGEITYFFEGIKSKEMRSERFLIIQINNNRNNFYLGLSDYLNDDSGAYQEVKRAISIGDVIDLKGYFVRGGLITEGYYNIVEFGKGNVVYLNYDTMVAAIQSESDFNFKLFLFLNVVVVILFVVSLIKGDEECSTGGNKGSNKGSEGDDGRDTKLEVSSESLEYGETITTWAADVEGSPYTFRCEHQFWTGRKKYYINDKLVRQISGGLIESCRSSVAANFHIDSHDIQFLFRAAREFGFSYGGAGYDDMSEVFDKDAGVVTSMELSIDGTKIKGSMKSARRMAGWAAPLFVAIIVILVLCW